MHSGPVSFSIPGGLPSGVTSPSGTSGFINNGVVSIIFDVATGVNTTFDLTLSAAGSLPACVISPYTETMTADCAVSCSLTASAVVDQNESCGGSNDGEATASGSGGSGNYDFGWDDPNSQTTATATGLAPSMYTVTVTDTTDGCTCLLYTSPSPRDS